MRLLAILLLPFALLCAGQNKVARKGAKPAATAKKKVVVKLEVPAGATQTAPETWRYTDKKGETWIYRRTPFGMTRFPEPPAQPEAELPQGLKAVQAGDEIQFERPGPFGITRWSRKPDQLNEIERRVWERDRPKQDSPADAKDAVVK